LRLCYAGGMAKPANPIPPGFHTVTPHFNVKGAAAYSDFLQRAFGAVEVSRSPGPGGKLMHVHVRIGDSNVMFADQFPEFGAPAYVEGNYPFHLHVYIPDVDAIWAKALAAGCTATMPLSDAFWGDRYGHVRDPFGFEWALATRKEELTPEEMQERQNKAFSSGGGAL
jgi:PhnB protein